MPNTELVPTLSPAETLVTATPYLAANLRYLHDRQRRRAGEVVWGTLDALPWRAWLARTWAGARDAGLLRDDAPVALADGQIRAVWRRVVAADNDGRLLHVERTASAALAAWRSLDDWGLAWSRLPAGSEDQERFQSWCAGVERILAASNWIDGAQVADRLLDPMLWSRLLPGRQVRFEGFPDWTPRQRRLLGTLAQAAVGVVRADPENGGPALVRRHEFADSPSQWQAVAQWAAAHFDGAADAVVGILVPGLAEQRSVVSAALARAFEPSPVLDIDYPSRPTRAEFGMVLQLNQAPSIRCALDLLRLLAPTATREVLYRVLLSPHLRGGVAERWPRVRLEARLRDLGGTLANFERVRLLAGQAGEPHHCPLLRPSLADLSELRRSLPSTQRPAQWAVTFSRCLTLFGWPAEEGPEDGYPLVQAWRDLLGELAALDLVEGALTLAEALERIERLAGETAWPTEQRFPSLSVLEPADAVGMRFDHLWVADLGVNSWPRKAAVNPFLPAVVRQRMGNLSGTPETQLALARRQQALWLTSAQTLALSHARETGGLAQAPSPLIVEFDSTDPPRPTASWLDRLRGAVDLDETTDDTGPPVAGTFAGGTGLLKDQAACPFRAFARHRLRAASLPPQVPALDAAARGRLLHLALAALWRELGSQARALELAEAARTAVIDRAVAKAVAELASQVDLGTQFWRLEATRLNRLLAASLDHDLARSPFEVAAVEQNTQQDLGRLHLRTRIDRIDAVAEGELILDYKTGQTSLADWAGQRMAEPQLPLYSLQRGAAIGVAFYRVSVEQVGLKGISDAAIDGLQPVSKADPEQRDWQNLRRSWDERLHRLAEEFLSGQARVDPRDGGETCRYCDLGPLCRIDSSARAP